MIQAKPSSQTAQFKYFDFGPALPTFACLMPMDNFSYYRDAVQRDTYNKTALGHGVLRAGALVLGAKNVGVCVCKGIVHCVQFPTGYELMGD